MIWCDILDSNIVAEYDLMSHHQIFGSDTLLDMIWYRIRSLDLILYQIVGSDIVSDHIIWYVASNYWIWYQIRSYNLIPCQIILWSDMISDSNIVLESRIWSDILSDHILLDMTWYRIRSHELILYLITESDIVPDHLIWCWFSSLHLTHVRLLSDTISDHMI